MSKQPFTTSQTQVRQIEIEMVTLRKPQSQPTHAVTPESQSENALPRPAQSEDEAFTRPSSLSRLSSMDLMEDFAEAYNGTEMAKMYGRVLRDREDNCYRDDTKDIDAFFRARVTQIPLEEILALDEEVFMRKANIPKLLLKASMEDSTGREDEGFTRPSSLPRISLTDLMEDFVEASNGTEMAKMYSRILRDRQEVRDEVDRNIDAIFRARVTQIPLEEFKENLAVVAEPDSVLLDKTDADYPNNYDSVSQLGDS